MVDLASIAVERRKRRAKTDRLDVEKLLRTPMGWARGERRIRSMVRPPNPQQEDARRIIRECETLVTERTTQINRIKGLLATQGIFDFEPRLKHRCERLEEIRRWDGQRLPPRLKQELLCDLHRLELVLSQINAVEAARDLALKQAGTVETIPEGDNPGALLVGTGPKTVSVLSSEAFFRCFDNRREVAA